MFTLHNLQVTIILSVLSGVNGACTLQGLTCQQVTHSHRTALRFHQATKVIKLVPVRQLPANQLRIPKPWIFCISMQTSTKANHPQWVTKRLTTESEVVAKESVKVTDHDPLPRRE